MSKQLRLSLDDSSCTIESVTPSLQTPRALVIDRNSFNIQLANTVTPSSNVQTIYGIFGAIRLNSGVHLIVITKADKVGQIKESDVFRIRETSIINLGKEKGVSSAEGEDDSNYVRLIKAVLAIEFFYFSYDYDLTRSLQRAEKRAPSEALWKKVDKRFFWNRYCLKDFIEKSKEKETELGDFILPVILGFVSINHVNISGRSFDYILLTRRDVRRAGTRYNTRGIDVDGNVANFNETEQIVYEPSKKIFMSYVQTRGSIPIFWRQLINLKYTPELEVEPVDQSLPYTREHFREQQEIYGNQIVVNLINGAGYEGKVNKAFADTIQKLQNPQLSYVHFDFHHECKKMRFDKVSKLIDKISEQLENQRYFFSEKDEVKLIQKSVVRTNCMDCLDRTNVVQSVLARRILRLQLKELKIIQEALEESKEFDSLLKNVWADHADAVSMVYSGTGALKTDFTRLGKRTQLGVLQDGVNSVWRYIANNFMDGNRQDGFDLLLGNYVVRQGPSPFATFENNDNAIRRSLLPSMLILSILMFFTNLFVPTESWFLKIFYFVFWTGVIYFSLVSILKNSGDFVSKPKFADPTFGKRSSKISKD